MQTSKLNRADAAPDSANTVRQWPDLTLGAQVVAFVRLKKELELLSTLTEFPVCAWLL